VTRIELAYSAWEAHRAGLGGRRRGICAGQQAWRMSTNRDECERPRDGRAMESPTSGLIRLPRAAASPGPGA
jgi:hypothetical protein